MSVTTRQFGPSRLRCLTFALLSMVLVWLLFAVAVLVSGAEFIPVMGWMGIWAFATYLLFTTPVVLLPVPWQLRYWYVLLLLSLVWVFGLASFFSHESPWKLIHETYPGSVLVWALVIYATFSVATYLGLLRLSRRTRRFAG